MWETSEKHLALALLFAILATQTATTVWPVMIIAGVHALVSLYFALKGD